MKIHNQNSNPLIQTIHSELSKAKARNPRVSLRRFAVRLGISSSALSEILNGKRNVSPQMAEKILSNLALEPNEKSAILNSLYQHSLSDPGNHLRSYVQIETDQFRLISEWHHFAILSLAETTTFQSDSNWIANRLGITKIEATRAIDRLVRLDMIVRDQDGQLRSTGRSFASPDGIANIALRQAHFEDLHLCREAMDTVQIELRDAAATTMAIDLNKIPEAKKLIRQFRSKIAKLLESGSRTNVYKFGMYLFPLDKTHSNSNSNKPKTKRKGTKS